MHDLLLDHSPFEDHVAAPRGRGRLAEAEHSATAGGNACGDLVRLSVRVAGDRVAEAGFDAHGCAATVAAGSAVVELVTGASVLAAAQLSATALADALGGLSPARFHAAALAADALHAALGAAARSGALRLRPSARRTLVAMSGGVDSAVAAQLALERGHEVVAVTLELWADASTDGERSCCSPQAVTGARALAHSMGLPHLTLDLREAFRAEVVDDFLTEYAAGRTPNPCVRCNGLVRFDEMLALTERLGAARLTTGHYARIARSGGGEPLLEAAADPAKDQTYMLARLAPAQLSRLDFPLGELEKPVVRELARRAGLAVAERPESQDLCFLAGVGKQSFLRRHGRTATPLPTSGQRGGEIVDEGGKVLGTHDGQDAFTVGQRRGLGIAAPEPLYVLRRDAAREQVVVGPREALRRRHVPLRDAVLHRAGAEVDHVRLRSHAPPVACRVQGSPGVGTHARLDLVLESAVDGVAPGQTACLLAGGRVLGFAIICEEDLCAA